jgi:uncharacterized protein YfaS (alpha-2-macroglobulin family)
MKSSRFLQLFMLLIACTLLTLPSCRKKKDLVLVPDAKFREYISAYTSGLISAESSIRIQLAADYNKTVEVNSALDDKLFSFSPSIKGQTYWRDNRTLEFVPDAPLESGKTYTCSFNLAKILEVPDDMKKFEFGFQVIPQSFSVTLQGYKPIVNSNLALNRIRGTILTADVIDGAALEKVLSAVQEDKQLKISWTHEDSKTLHHFTIDSVGRYEKESKVEVSWNGAPIGIKLEGKEEFRIPSLSEFILLSTQVIQQPNQCILIQFSDPLAKNQNLDGLIRLGNGVSLTFSIEDNELRVYPAQRQSGSEKLIVEQGIRNSMGYKFPDTREISIAFEEVKPLVRLKGKGVILPNSQGLIFPFEAVNLKAVDVKIVQIFENNITQFLQVNSLDGNDQLKRVGRLIKKVEVPLTSATPIDFGAWNSFTLDLAGLIKQQPGAIYRVEIGFRKKHSLYPCSESEQDEEQVVEASDDETDEAEFSWWDSWEEYGSYYEDGEYYYYDNWEEEQEKRNDPCNAKYYNNKSVARNILASDLGIIAKGGSDHRMTFAVTDLRSTEPMSGVTLELYSYQNQLISSIATDGDGLATVNLEQIPFLLVAKSGEQRGYLKLDDGSSLSLSSFDVSGGAVQKGIKGFIYGERGVWRPGDTLFLTFMLEDKQGLVPDNHPVTMDLVNPQGQLVKRLVRSSGNRGIYQFTTTTEASAPTGNWTANIKVGGTSFSKVLRIETVKPNRLKIKLDFGVDQLSTNRPDVNGILRATWLHGAIARNLKAKVAVTLASIPTRFEKFPEFIFNDPARSFSSEEQTIFDGSLDESGEAVFSSELPAEQTAPGMLNASFVTRVFEEGGDFSIDRYSIPYAPYETFVGIRLPKGDKSRGMLLTDTNHVVQVVTLDPDGNPVSVTGLQAKVYKVEWRWWWDRSGDDLANFVGNEYHQPVMDTKLNTVNGKGSFSFRVNYPEWGRYLVRVYDPAGGHASGNTVYIDWPGWAGRSQEKFPGNASRLIFSADKEKYNAGETATVTFPSGGQGRALVSIESGSRVVNAWWVEAQKDQTVFNFKVTEEMAPNVYIHITLVQPHAQTANDLPIRMYGVVPINVEDPGTRLAPQIAMPDVLQPEKSFTVKVSEQNGKEMSYTLAVVDDGLLDLTRFKTPDPWNQFYAREALGVKTWDLYDMVIGAYGGKIEQLLSIGGDEEAKDAGAKSKANRFKPVVIFLGPYSLGAGKTASHTLVMPRYVGSVRTMVIAGNEKAYGFTEKTVPVRKPLMVVATLPRVLGPGENVDLPVTVFAMEKSIKNVKVEIKTDKLLIPQEGTSQSFVFDQPGDQTINFPVKVASAIGVSRVQVIATSGNETARYDIEIDVRNANPPKTTFTEGLVEAGKNWQTNWQEVGMTGTNKTVLEVSTLPPIDFGRRLRYLIAYPHGCIEQTTSSAFPQLFLGDVIELNDALKQSTQKNILAAISRLKSFARADGGFSYWPGSGEASDWGTTYAGHFLLEAEAKGFALPPGMKQSWIRYQRNAARDWTANRGKYQYYAYNQSDLEQAYRLYTLALAGEPEQGAMNRLRERKELSIEAAWRLAAAYVIAGQPEVAKQLTAGKVWETKSYSAFCSTYGSAERDWAMILETMVLMDEREKAFPIVKKLSQRLTGDYWYSTQTTAYSLLAISKFAGKGQEGLRYEYAVNGSKAVNASTNKPVDQVEIGSDKNPSGSVSITNRGTGVLFARVISTGIPEAGDESDAANGISMSIVYTDLNDNEIDVSSLPQGTDFIARVTLTHSGLVDYYTNLALTQIFPSGWEIRNTRFDQADAAHQGSRFDYQDVRDDRVLTYFGLPRHEQASFFVYLNATYTGKFWLPATLCEAMYDGTVNARVGGQWVEVTK